MDHRAELARGRGALAEGSFTHKVKAGVSAEQKDWLRRKAFAETRCLNRRVSEAEVLRTLIDAAMAQDPDPEKTKREGRY